MLRRPSWSLRELALWVRWGHGPERAHDLLRPLDMLWPEAPDAFDLHRDIVGCAFGDGITLQALAAAALTGSRGVPFWATEWCARNIDPKALGLPFDWETALSIRWTCAPVLLARKGAGQVCRFLLGLLPKGGDAAPTPVWWGNVADPDARRAVSDVLVRLEEVEGARVFVWPLLPDAETVRLRGPSLALPIYLAAWGLKREMAADGLTATGIIRADGSLQSVAYLEDKLSLASAEGFHALVTPYPPEPTMTAPDGMELLGVSNLEEAQYIWGSYVPSEGSRLLHQYRFIGEPRWVAVNSSLLTPHLLKDPTSKARYVTALDSIAETRDLVVPWLDSLEHMAGSPEACPRTMRRLLDPVDVARVLDLAARFPLHGFRIAQLQVNCANHCGDPELAIRWAEVSRRLEEPLGAYEQELDFSEDRINKQFIAERHNRYDFRASIPEDMALVLADLRTVHAGRKRRSLHAVCRSLGKLCGTLAQNYGFCGPDFLGSVEDMVRQSQEAFGEGKVPEYREDWLRQFNHLTYAFLDAKQFDRAGKALEAYLGGPPDGLPVDRIEALNRYQHALLSRYLAETGLSAPIYLSWATKRCTASFQSHPWQLWLLNLGSLVRDLDTRGALWVRSVECCLALGPTAHPMALLALSRLLQSGLAEKEWLEPKIDAVLSCIRSCMLSKEHFKTLLEAKDWRAVLHATAEQQGRVFPFSYR